MLRAGNQLMDLGLPKETLAILVRRQRRTQKGEVLFVPTGKTELQDNDRLLLISNNKESLDNIENFLIEHASMHQMPIHPYIEKSVNKLKKKVERIKGKV